MILAKAQFSPGSAVEQKARHAELALVLVDRTAPPNQENSQFCRTEEARLGQDAVSQTAVSECPGQLLRVKLVWESKFNPAGLVKHPYLVR